MNYKILCQDSLVWLKKQKDGSISNFVTGIPDMNELTDQSSLDKYLKFFNEVSELMFKKVSKDGYCILIQTDRKFNGQLIDKSFIITNCAYKCGFKLLWHKIICQREVGKIDLHRPTYSHFLCYSVNGKPGQAFADVLDVGEKLYSNATPLNGAQAATEFISKQVKNQKSSNFPYQVVDPFVGQGTIGLASLEKNLSFFGIDIDEKQCKLAEQLLNTLKGEISH